MLYLPDLHAAIMPSFAGNTQRNVGQVDVATLALLTHSQQRGSIPMHLSPMHNAAALSLPGAR